MYDVVCTRANEGPVGSCAMSTHPNLPQRRATCPVPIHPFVHSQDPSSTHVAAHLVGEVPLLVRPRESGVGVDAEEGGERRVDLHDGLGLVLSCGQVKEGGGSVGRPLMSRITSRHRERSSATLYCTVLRTAPMPGMDSSWCSQVVRASSPSLESPLARAWGRGVLDLVRGVCVRSVPRD